MSPCGKQDVPLEVPPSPMDTGLEIKGLEKTHTFCVLFAVLPWILSATSWTDRLLPASKVWEAQVPHRMGDLYYSKPARGLLRSRNLVMQSWKGVQFLILFQIKISLGAMVWISVPQRPLSLRHTCQPLALLGSDGTFKRHSLLGEVRSLGA